jgi:hypothetical protein
MLDWTNIITTLIGTGGIGTLLYFFLTSTEKKAQAQLTNMQRMYDNMQGLYDKLQARYDVETDKVGKLYEQLAQKNDQLDEANTKAATRKILCCEVVNCTKRVPPLYYNSEFDKEVDEKARKEETADE